MATVRELVTKLSFRVDQTKLRNFDKKIGDIRNNVQGLTKNMRGFASSVRNVGVGLSAFVTLPLTALGFVALKTTADLEKAKIALEVFLGSEEAALEKQKELIEFAKVTPFQILGIQQTAGQLLAAGIESKKLIPTLNALGNAAKGNSEVFQRLVLNFSQVKTQGKLTGRDLRDFLVNQVPLVQLLAKQLGVSEKAIAKMTSTGKIKFKDVEDAFFNASKEGGFFFDLMKKQSRTLSGRFSNLQDTVTQLLDEFGKAIDRTFGLKEGMEALTKFIDKVRNRFTALSPNVKKLIIVFVALVALLGPLLIFLGTITIAILSLTAAAAALNIALFPLIAIIFGIVAAFIAVGVAIFLVIDDFIAFKAGGDSVIGSLIARFKQFGSFIAGIAKSIAIFFVNAWNETINAFNVAFSKIIELIKIVMDKIGSFILPFIVLITDALANLVTNIVESVFGAFTKSINFIKGGLSKLGNFGKSILGKLFGGENKIDVASAGIANVSRQINGDSASRSLIPNASNGLSRSIQNNANQTSLNQNINIEVPPGTPEQQVRFIEDSARESFDKMFNNEMTKNLMATPLAEQ